MRGWRAPLLRHHRENGLPDALRTVWFGHAPAASRERYAQAFRVPVRFGAPCNALLLHPERLDDPVDPDASAPLPTFLDIVQAGPPRQFQLSLRFTF